MPKRKLGIIFGRRSGTSTMAKGLLERGFPLRGPLDTKPYITQPGGHYENTQARAIDKRILEHFKMHANVPGVVPFLVHLPLRHWVERHPAPFVVKEPTINLVWPVWFRTLSPDYDIVGVWCHRPALDQAESLMRNYGLDKEAAYFCVEMYNNSIVMASFYIDMLDVDIADPERVDKAAAFLVKRAIVPQENTHDEPAEAQTA